MLIVFLQCHHSEQKHVRRGMSEKEVVNFKSTMILNTLLKSRKNKCQYIF